jgi:hypothetical protein
LHVLGVFSEKDGVLSVDELGLSKENNQT